MTIALLIAAPTLSLLLIAARRRRRARPYVEVTNKLYQVRRELRRY